MEESIKEVKSISEVEASTSTRIASQLGSSKNELDPVELSACCKKTIARHAAFNPMILCSGCQHIIKCFTGQKLYQQYLKFCNSRGRKVLAGCHSPYYVVIYRSFDSASM